MQNQASEQLPIRSEEDIVLVRRQVRIRAVDIRLSLLDQTKIVTAASELARNTLIYGKGGTCSLEVVQVAAGSGIRLTFEDQGPGIPDLDQALTDGFTSGSGMGMGLSGSKRLVNEFDIQSVVGKGTKIVITKWRGH
jgi:serine/threonine-protein kinase RsbT